MRLRHAFTMKLPPQYRTLGDQYVAISLFVDEQWETPPASKNVGAGGAGGADPRRFDIQFMDNDYVLFWLTEEEFAAPLDGLRESTSPCVDTSGDPDIGFCASRSANLGCSPIGLCFMDTVEQWEPDDARVSRPVLRAWG